MTETAEIKSESRAFEADVAKLLQLMVHSVYSDKEIFLRELISNSADACERLRYEAIANPALLGDDPKPRIVLRIDAEARTLTVEDNGIGMSRDEVVASVTSRAAAAIGKSSELGSLAPGMAADAVVMDLEDGHFTYVDGAGNAVPTTRRFRTRHVIRDGRRLPAAHADLL